MIKTYTLGHSLHLDQFFTEYRSVLNRMLHDIWNHIQWKTVPLRGKKQIRVLPVIPSYAFKKEMRNQYLKGWRYASHWVDSALKTAFSITKSWKKNYAKGNRKRAQPTVSKSFARVKQTLMKREGDRIRITIKPHEYVYIDLSKRHFKIKGKIGEPILTPTSIHIPILIPDLDPAPVERVGWDSNKSSLDGYSPQRGWEKIDLKPLHTLHTTYDNKMRGVNRLYSKNRKKGKRLYQKYRNRERNRVKNYLCHVAKEITLTPRVHGFEALEKRGMNRKHSRRWNRELNHTDWRKMVKLVSNRAPVVEVNPYGTSRRCSRCGGTNNNALRGEPVFECPKCGLRVDRQLNAAINIYLRMRGASRDGQRQWFDETVLGGLPLIRAERRAPDELVRELSEVLKPQVYVSLPLTT